MSGERQAVLAVLRLVGPQDIGTSVEFPGTAQTVVTARVGSSLLYLHERQTAAHVHRVWEDAWLDAKLLPRHTSPRLVAPVAGTREPGVVVHATGRPAASTALVRPTGGLAPYLRVQVGRLVFEVRDVRAFGSCLGVFREAHDLARAAFAGPGAFSVRAGTLAAATDAFTPPTPQQQAATGANRARGRSAADTGRAPSSGPSQDRKGGRTP